MLKRRKRFLSPYKEMLQYYLELNWTLAGNEITITIALGESNSYISTKFANHLVFPESNIREELDFWDKKQIEISGLQLNVGDYMVISKFIVSYLLSFDGDIILGLPWIKTLGTFILNVEKKFMAFSYKQNRITFQDITMKSYLEAPKSEDFKDILKMISRGNQNSE